MDVAIRYISPCRKEHCSARLQGDSDQPRKWTQRDNQGETLRRRLVIPPAARPDLVDVADFIALENPERAMSLFAEIEAKMEQNAARPERFSVRVGKN